jgi:DNA repair protein RadA
VTSNSTVLYFNDEHPHVEAIGEVYAKYADQYGEAQFEDGFVVSGAPLQVLGLPSAGFDKTRVSAIYRERADRVYRVRTSRGGFFEVTGAHRFLTVTDEGVQWVPAAKLSVGDPVAAPKRIPVETGLLSEDDAYFLGLFVAEGTANPLSLCNADQRIIDWVREYVEKRFGYAPRVRAHGSAPHVSVVFFRKPTSAFLGNLAHERAGTKRVPTEVFSASDGVVRRFLGGYLDGDGSVEPNVISATTKSPLLATDLAYLFARLGVRVTLGEKIINGETYHIIFVVGFDRDGLRIPMITKQIPSIRTRNSAHGYPTRIPEYLAMIYRRTLGGHRGRRRKAIGRVANEGETFYHVLTRSRFKGKTINDGTFRRIVQEFLAGHERLDEARRLAEKLDVMTDPGFKELVDLLPFPYESLATELGLSPSALRNYVWRGLPKNQAFRRRLRSVLLPRIEERLKMLGDAFPQIRNIHSMAWDEIVSVEIQPHNDWVYDFVVPDGHAFVGGSIPTFMHNSQIGHQLAVNVTRPEDDGGMNGDTVWIDTEQTFRPERIRHMSDALDLDADAILKRIHVARAFNSHHQMLLVEKAQELTQDFPIRLIVIDSLTAHFRAEFIGRGVLAERQQLLNKHIHELMRFGDIHNAVVYVTNQVHAKPDAFFGDPTRPVGGHIVGHSATFRVYLRKSKGGKRIARLIDSPSLPEAEAVFSVSEDGIRD